ncbi:MAG: hypothetical protein HKN44_13410 [Ilumatobacter sp.]|nr:hypothetical protein [Ilumatobacter sp.]
MKRALFAVTLVSAGLLALGPVFAAPPGVSTGASATETAGRSARQKQVNPPPPPPAPTAVYRITINIAFDTSTHPGTAPGNAHVSNPVIATHSIPGAMFVVGGFASPGIETMAELGRTDTLVPELNAKPQVGTVQVTGGLFGIGTRVVDVTLTHSDDMISMVTMLAPSPDWFIGFADLDMLGYGGWRQSASFPLNSYDAGTDSGPNFNSNDADTQPSETISGPRDPAFIASAGQNPFGTVSITRIG